MITSPGLTEQSAPAATLSLNSARINADFDQLRGLLVRVLAPRNDSPEVFPDSNELPENIALALFRRMLELDIDKSFSAIREILLKQPRSDIIADHTILFFLGATQRALRIGCTDLSSATCTKQAIDLALEIADSPDRFAKAYVGEDGAKAAICGALMSIACITKRDEEVNQFMKCYYKLVDSFEYFQPHFFSSIETLVECGLISDPRINSLIASTSNKS